MKDDNFAVFGELNIQFDPVTVFSGFAECGRPAARPARRMVFR